MGDERETTVETTREGIIAALSAGVRDLFARPLNPGLHLVATPIGNLGDVTPRALITLAKADHVYCEDTRVSRPMLTRLGVNRQLSTYHEHNADAARKEILRALDEGSSVALISDAGMPAISDPGFKLTRDVIAAGVPVYSVPGPTALTAALTISGLPTDCFLFAGFLPQKAVARRTRIEALASIPATLIFYESPHRITASLRDLADVLGPRDAALARELTKKYEEVRRGSLPQLATWSNNEAPRGEIAIVVGSASANATTEVDEETILAALKIALLEMGPAAAAKSISKEFGIPRSRVYDLSLFLKNGTKS